MIAIIAILAAILFPVFAQAKAAAKKTACLSNVKQQTLAFVMYSTDYDDNSPMFKDKYGHQVDGNGNWVSGGYWFDLLQPYTKNFGIVFCPERNLVDPGEKGYVPAQNGQYYEPGYGYDDGFVSDSGWGLTTQQEDPYHPGKTYRPGKNLSAILTPAAMVAFGDSYDTGSMSAANDNAFSGPDGPTGTSRIRHGMRENFGFVDGHARNLGMVAGIYNAPDGPYYVARASSQTDALMWCCDPNQVSDYLQFQGDSSGYPVNNANETCGQVVADWFNPAYFTIVP